MANNIDNLIDKFIELLPHGSGINGDWNVKVVGNGIEVSNAYDYMNEAGYYMGSIGFSIPILLVGGKMDIGDIQYDMSDSVANIILDCIGEDILYGADEPMDDAELDECAKAEYKDTMLYVEEEVYMTLFKNVRKATEILNSIVR